MKLLGRTTRPDDLDRCVALVRDGFLYDAAARADLKRLWRSLIERDVGRSAVVFDAGRPERIVAFGVSAAIDDVRLDAIVARRSSPKRCSMRGARATIRFSTSRRWRVRARATEST